MALSKTVVTDRIEILEDETLQVRVATRIYDDGVLISEQYHRHVVTPLEDTTNESAKVQQIAAMLHTPAVKAAYQAKLNANN